MRRTLIIVPRSTDDPGDPGDPGGDFTWSAKAQQEPDFCNMGRVDSMPSSHSVTCEQAECSGLTSTPSASPFNEWLYVPPPDNWQSGMPIVFRYQYVAMFWFDGNPGIDDTDGVIRRRTTFLETVTEGGQQIDKYLYEEETNALRALDPTFSTPQFADAFVDKIGIRFNAGTYTGQILMRTFFSNCTPRDITSANIATDRSGSGAGVATRSEHQLTFKGLYWATPGDINTVHEAIATPPGGF